MSATGGCGPRQGSGHVEPEHFEAVGAVSGAGRRQSDRTRRNPPVPSPRALSTGQSQAAMAVWIRHPCPETETLSLPRQATGRI